jgi:DNA-binding transcriptional LysR family regulator
MQMEIAAAVAGLGIAAGFEEFFVAELARGTLVEILSDWMEDFPGPSLYYHSRRLMPAPLRAFIDFVRADGKDA